MVSQKVTIKNPTGLHLRPAGILCKEATPPALRLLACAGPFAYFGEIAMWNYEYSNVGRIMS